MKSASKCCKFEMYITRLCGSHSPVSPRRLRLSLLVTDISRLEHACSRVLQLSTLAASIRVSAYLSMLVFSDVW